jgi:hypothetical protein
MTPVQALAENLKLLPGSAADKAAQLGIHKSTLFAWIAEAEGRAPSPRDGRAGRKRHRDATWHDVLVLAELSRAHGKSVTTAAAELARLASRELSDAMYDELS